MATASRAFYGSLVKAGATPESAAALVGLDDLSFTQMQAGTASAGEKNTS